MSNDKPVEDRGDHPNLPRGQVGLRRRLVKALNDGFNLMPTGQRKPMYWLRDGHPIRKGSAIKLAAALDRWDARQAAIAAVDNGHAGSLSRITAETDARQGIQSAFSDEAVQAVFLLRKLSPEIRKFVYEFVVAAESKS